MELLSLALAFFAFVQLSHQSSVYNTSATLPFAVDSLPGIDLPIGENYAGLLPISDNKDETRELFFWFWPTTDPNGSTDILIWLQGGPGCSSLDGVFTENGKIVWYPGSDAAVENPWSITNLANVLYVDQPVGTGYSGGMPDIRDETDLAQEFLGFYKNFKDLFGIQKYKNYITGESYAGYFTSAIADAFISRYQSTCDDADYFELAGVMMHSPIVGDQVLSQTGDLMPYGEKWRDILLYNDTTFAQLEKQYNDCGYAQYVNTWFKFPAPQEPALLLPFDFDNDTCGSFRADFMNFAHDVNPCFNPYHIPSFCPIVSNVIPDPDGYDFAPGTTNYFNRTDVKLALHVSPALNFTTCSAPVYIDDTDLTKTHPPAADGTLQRVIEFTNNTFIGNGGFDATLTINGTLLAIQNMTWNGQRGFDQYPANAFWTPKPDDLDSTMGQSITGTVGTWVRERGLTYFTVRGAGHEIWTYVPAAAFRTYEVLLGRIEDLSSTEDFTVSI